ncbi:non-heme iron oxygenase ferredoxin subunit [Novosphingobium flavum]|uniref:Non-heme iron oxygenase ferredoxin subunit n=1 Tax=Novosphingobium flavum TaxID=1778672 RepID=A0A7X1FVH3_9SPHN|nr:non-heme iron oxygenase ferredoxin subunit [Novosphingobium flavum]MBC2667132.1 non-heme iron oxygenase ferredoxin subunit [Novosphingobium flavum]
MWVKVLDSSELADGEMAGAQVGELAFALFRVDGAVFATSNICTHQYALMTDGYFDGALIECPLHQALFDVKTGAVIEGPTDKALTCFPAEEREDGIYVRLD